MSLEYLMIAGIICSCLTVLAFMVGMYIGYNEGYKNGYRQGQLTPVDWSELE